MTKPNHLRFKLSPLAASILAVIYPAIIYAAEDKALEEITVTATRRESNIQEVAASITAFTGDDIAQMGIKSMSDYIKAMPSVAMQATTPGRNQLVIRGISSGSNEYYTDGQVAVYLDEQPMTTNSQQVSVRPVDMQRIETLPGPQGTLFGSSSQTGTLRLITNKPDFNGFAGALEATTGSTTGGDDSYDFSGHLNIPINDALSMRVVGYRSHDGGYVDNILGTSLSGNFDNGDDNMSLAGLLPSLVKDDQNEYDVEGGRVAVLWNMSDNWSTLFSLVGENTDAQGTWETDPALGDNKITRFVKENRQDEWYSLALTVKGDLGFADVAITGTVFEREIAYEWDNNTYAQAKDRRFGGPAYVEFKNASYNSCVGETGNPGYACYYHLWNNELDSGYSYYPYYNAEYIHSTIVNDQSQDRETLEIRLISRGESKLQWMAGAYYENVYDEWFYYTHQPDLMSTIAWTGANAYAYYAGVGQIAYPLAPTTIGYSNTFEREVEQIAVFGELGYDLTDNFKVTAGVRWSQFDRDEFVEDQYPQGLPAYHPDAATPDIPNDGGFVESTFSPIGKDKDVIYKVGAQYNIDEDKMVYFLFSQGFRLGGVNSPRAARTGLIPASYDADFLNNYELGIKSRWLDDSLQINAQLFVMKWSDYQQSVSGLGGSWWIRGTANGGDAETIGVELNLSWQVTSRLSIDASLFNANPEFVDNVVIAGDQVIRKGMPMPGSPEQKAWMSLTYTIPDVLGGELWFYYDIAYQSETWNNKDNILTRNTNGLAPSWTHANLQIGLDLQNDWSVKMKVNNLNNKTNYSYVSTVDNENAAAFGDARWHNIRTYDRPRTVWFSVKKSF